MSGKAVGRRSLWPDQPRETPRGPGNRPTGSDARPLSMLPARGTTLVPFRGVPSRRGWVAPSYVEVEWLRAVASDLGLNALELVRALTIHRARVRLAKTRGR